MIGSAFASEIATMRVTEQIDGLKVLKVNPVNYLFVPRVVAGFIMMPIVVIISSTFGLICAGVASYLSANVSKLNYISSLWQGLFLKDILVALGKSACFGAAIAIISCTCGYLAYGGAKGVGVATTKAVVWSFIAICIIDYIFAMIFFF
jgi:phospholipid/cholesterol/gamma-HCH transport system permease protein